MKEDFSKFKEFYKDQIVTTFKQIDLQKIDEAIGLLKAAVTSTKNTIYIFGNGGSHAIARHLGTSLGDSLKDFKHSLRISYGLDYHVAQAGSGNGEFDNIFVQTLELEKVDAHDLVILISGRGDSTNLLLAADYCIENGIPAISFSGFDGGQLAKKQINLNIVAEVNDQQICEDVIQPLQHVIVECLAKDLSGQSYDINDSINNYAQVIQKVLENADSQFFINLAEAITTAFLEDKTVYVLGPEGHGLSISAEHIAHNLNWDAVYLVQTPPQRNLVSSPTHTDFSGVGNDRLIPGIVTVQQLDKAKQGDVALFFIHDVANAAVDAAIKKAQAHGMKIFIIAGTENNGAEANFCYIKTSHKNHSADIAQAMGHMTGRLVRLMLKIKLKEIEPEVALLEYLKEQDLAQRRLLDKPGL